MANPVGKICKRICLRSRFYLSSQTKLHDLLNSTFGRINSLANVAKSKTFSQFPENVKTMYLLVSKQQSFHNLKDHQVLGNRVTAWYYKLCPLHQGIVFSFVEKCFHSHQGISETFVQRLTFLCIMLVLLFLVELEDNYYPLAITIGQCNTSDSGGGKAQSEGKSSSIIKGTMPPEKEKTSEQPCIRKDQGKSLSLKEAIEKSRLICQRKKDELGSPGLVVSVSVDGKQIYAEGFGYADLENETPIHPKSVLRIASISKSMTAIIVAKLWEEGKIDLNKPVQHYVPDFPQKYFMGEKVTITVGHLLNHTSGIRHYKEKKDPIYAFDRPIIKLIEGVKGASLSPFYAAGPVAKAPQKSPGAEPKMSFGDPDKTKDDEMFLKHSFSTTAESLKLFQNEPLLCKPGSRFVYTTHGFTLLSAIVESVTRRPFTETVTKMFHCMGLKESYLDQNDPLIYNRARFYMKNKRGTIVNVPYVNNSYKWAGGGLLSTVEDLGRFGNILLYSSQHEDCDQGPRGYLKASTIWKFWSPPIDKLTPYYGLGFELTQDEQHYGMCGHHTFGAGHTGNAVGASSMLFILPRSTTTGMFNNAQSEGSNLVKNTPRTDSLSMKAKCGATQQNKENGLPQGVVVAVVVNLPEIGLRNTARDIARLFENVDFSL